MKRWILGTVVGLTALAPALAADQPVIKSVTFTPLPVSANAPAGTPIGTLDVSITGTTAKPTVKTYTDSSICTLPASPVPATVTLSKPLSAGSYACTFIAALSNTIGSPFLQTIVFNVQPTTPVPDPTLTLSATPAEITVGGKTTVAWNTVNASSCVASGGWSGQKAVAGTEDLSPTQDATYNLDCQASTGKHVTKSASVKVNPVQPPPPPPTGQITLYQHCPYAGWSATFGKGKYTTADLIAHGAFNNDASSARVPSGLQVTLYDGDNFSGTSVTLTGDTSCFTTTNPAFNDMVSSMIVADAGTPPPPPPAPGDPTLKMSANPSQITAGGQTTLTWNGTDIAAGTAPCTASGLWSGSKAANGSESIKPTASGSADLSCPGVNGKTATASAPITVGQQPPPPPPPPPTPSADNKLSVSAGSGAPVAKHPLQFLRPFVCGEILHFPQVVVNGNPVASQAEVKNRCPDGSVKAAVISAQADLPATGSITLTFRDQPTGNTAPVTTADLLSQFPEFEATIALTGSANATTPVSARQMMQDGNCKAWTSGPVEVVLQCGDRSTARIYDKDPTGNGWKPFHPEFELSFWLATKQVQVRYIGGVMNSTALEAFTAGVRLTAGKSNPTVVFQQDSIPHSIRTRWSRTAFIGGAPEPKVNIDHNIAYLSKTGYLWNFDPSIRIPESVLADAYAQWQSSDHGNILSPGLWMLDMGQTGYHADIGPMPLWYNRVLMSGGDWRMREVMLGQADLVGAFGMHVFEGDPARFTTRAKNVSALGLPVTQYVRPWYRGADAITVRSPKYNDYDDDIYRHSGFWADTSHQPDPFTVPYIETGDPFYLQGLQFWGAMDTFGPEGLYLWYYHSGQVRSQAWSLREVGGAWGMSPDADPMRAAFHDALDDIFAGFEGERDIHGTKFENTPAWNQTHALIGKTNVGEPWFGLGPPPLHFWNFLASNPEDCKQWYFNPNICTNDYTPWQVGFLGVAISHAIELGFDDARPVLRWFGENITVPMLDPNYGPGFAGTFIAPATKRGPDGQPAHFTSWADVKTAWSDTLINMANTYNAGVWLYWWATGGEIYWDVARGGIGTIADKVPNGVAAWRAFNDYNQQLIIHNGHGTSWEKDPTWNIIPRN